MEALGSLFVQQPANIVFVAGAFFVASAVLRNTPLAPGRRPRALLVPAFAWSLYAVWELVVLVRTPEANIRVDLLIIWPLLLGVSAFYTLRGLRRVEPAAPLERRRRR